MGFTLFFQAVLFYIPRYLWKVWEAGKVSMLVQGLNVPIVDAEAKEDRKKIIVNYFTDNRNNHDFYAFRFFFCELLNFINVVGQIYFMDFFLGGEFTTYGSDVIAMSEMEQNERVDPMAEVFPKVTKCTFHKFGPSGTIQKFDGLCILPVNIINEKIYFLLWFWLIALAIVTAIQQVYRLFTLFLPSMQQARMRGLARSVPADIIQDLSSKTGLGDWFLLCQLGKNIDPVIYREFIFE